MASPELKFIVTATDHASDVLGKVGKNTDALSKKTRALGDAGRMLGAGAIAAFGVASVKAFADAEQQTIRLQVAYQRFPALADQNIESMLKMNEQLQATTGFDNDAMAAAEAKLAMYKLTGTQIQELMPLILDYARAQNVDVVEAATNVGRAFIGNSRSLKAIGIQFKNTGDTAKDVATVMAELERTVGGTAEAFGAGTLGQIEITKQSFSDLQEEIGKQLVPALKTFLAVAKPILGWFGGLSEPAKSAIVVLTGLGAAALIAGPRILSMVVSIRAIPAASAAASASMTRFGGAMKGAGVAGAALAVGLPLVGQLVDKIGDNMFGVVPAGDALKESLRGIANGADPNRIANFGDKLHGLGREIEHLDNPGVSQRIEDFFGSLAGNGGGEGRNRVLENIKALNDGIAALVRDGHIDEARRALDAMKAAAIDDGASAEAVAQQFGPAETAIRGIIDPTATAAEVLDELTANMASGVDQAKLQADTIKNLKSALDELGGNSIDVDSALAAMYDSFQKGTDEVTKATEGTDKNTDAVTNNRRSLDLHTAAGRAAQGALAEIASKADSVATSMIAAGASTGEVNDKMGEARRAFIRTAMASGLSRKAARELADQYGLIPRKISTTITNNAASTVRQAVIDYIASLNSIPEERRTQIITEYITEGQKPQHPTMRAGGGYIRGAGTGTSDSIPAMLSNGEYVIRAASVSRAGVNFLHDLNDNGVIDNGMIDNVAITAGGRAIVSSARDRAQAQSAEFWSHTVLHVDGKQLAESLVKYKRSIGNRPLGVS